MVAGNSQPGGYPMPNGQGMSVNVGQGGAAGGGAMPPQSSPGRMGSAAQYYSQTPQGQM